MNKRELNRLIEQAAAQRTYPGSVAWESSYSGQPRRITGTRAQRAIKAKLDSLLEQGTINADGQRSSRVATEYYVSAFEIANNLKRTELK